MANVVPLFSSQSDGFGLALVSQDKPDTSNQIKVKAIALIYQESTSTSEIGFQIALKSEQNVTVQASSTTSTLLLRPDLGNSPISTTEAYFLDPTFTLPESLELDLDVTLSSHLSLQGGKLLFKNIAIDADGTLSGGSAEIILNLLAPNLLPERSMEWSFAINADPNANFLNYAVVPEGTATKFQFKLDNAIVRLQQYLQSSGLSLPTVSAIDITNSVLDVVVDNGKVTPALSCPIAGTVDLALGSSLASLQITSAAEFLFDVENGFALKLSSATAFTGNLSLDIFQKISSNVVINNIWLRDPLISSRLIKLEWSGFSFASDLLIRWLEGYPAIDKDLFNTLFQINKPSITVNDKQKLQSISGDVLGAISLLSASFNSAGGIIKVVKKDGQGNFAEVGVGETFNQLALAIPLKTIIQEVSGKVILEVQGEFVFDFEPSVFKDDLLYFQPGSLSCSELAQVTVEKAEGYHSNFNSLISLHIPAGTVFGVSCDPKDPYLEWDVEASKKNTEDKILVCIPAAEVSTSTELRSQTSQRFTFELASFKIHTAGIDLKGAIRSASVDLGAESGFSAPVAVKGVARSSPPGDSHQIGEIEFKDSKLVYGSLQASTQLKYFDDAYGILTLFLSQNAEDNSLKCAGNFEISTLQEFQVKALFTTYQIDVLNFTIDYENNVWIGRGSMSGRVKFLAPEGQSVNEAISELFRGVTVEFEELDPTQLEKATLSIATTPKRFEFLQLLQVDLRGLEIRSGKQLGLLGDLTMQRLPGVDASLTFGGITLLPGSPPTPSLSMIGAQFSIPGGFSMQGQLEYIDCPKESGFAGGFSLKMDAFPELSGLVKLTRIPARDGSMVPSIALFVGADVEVALFAGFFLRQLGVGLGLRQAIRGLEPSRVPLSKKLINLVNNPAGLPDPRQIGAWVPVQPESAQSRLDWMFVARGLITFGKFPSNVAHTLAGSLLLSIDQDLQIVLASNIWLFCSPDETKNPAFIQRPVARGAIGISVKEERLFAIFRTLKNPRLTDDAPPLLKEVLSRVETTMMFSADRNGFLVEVGWPWETRMSYKKGILSGELTSGFRFGIYRGVLSFGLNFGIVLELKASTSISFDAGLGQAEASLSVYGKGYFKASFAGALAKSGSQLQTYLLGDVRIGALLRLRAEASWSFRIRITRWIKITKRFSFSTSLDISLTAALTAALNPSFELAYQGEATVSVSVCGYRLQGRVKFGSNESQIEAVRTKLNQLLPTGSMTSRPPAFLQNLEASGSDTPQPCWHYRYRTIDRNGTKFLRVLLFPAPGFDYPRVTEDTDTAPRFKVRLLNRAQFVGFVGTDFEAQIETQDGKDYLIWNENLDLEILSPEEVRAAKWAERDQLSAQIQQLEAGQAETPKSQLDTLKSQLDTLEKEIQDLSAAELRHLRDLLRAVPKLKDSINPDTQLVGTERAETIDRRTLNAKLASVDDATSAIGTPDVNSPNLVADTDYDRAVTQAFSSVAESEEIKDKVSLTLTLSKWNDLKTLLESNKSDFIPDARLDEFPTIRGFIDTYSPSTKPTKYELDTSDNLIIFIPLPENDQHPEDLQGFEIRWKDPEAGQSEGELTISAPVAARYESEGLPSGLLLTELLELMRDSEAKAGELIRDPKAKAGEPKEKYSVAPHLRLLLEFSTEGLEQKLQKSLDPVPNLIDLNDPVTKLGTEGTRLRPVIDTALPEYDLIAGSYFQSAQQVCLTWEFKREDKPDDPFAAYAELERFVVTRVNLSKPNEKLRVTTVYPAWIDGTKGELIRPQFQFVDEVDDVERGSLLRYKIVAETPNPDRILATCLITVIRNYVEPLSPVSQSTVLQQIKLNDQGQVEQEAFDVVVALEEDSNNATKIAEQLTIRYRLVPATTIGSYGFDLRSAVKVEWTEGVPSRLEDAEFPQVKFASSEQSKPLPWVETEALPLKPEVAWKVIKAQPTSQNLSSTLGYRCQFSWDNVDWSKTPSKTKETFLQTLQTGMAIEFYVGRQEGDEDPSRVSGTGSSLLRSPLVKCRHAIAPAPLRPFPLTPAGTLNLSAGNTVDAIEWIPARKASQYLEPSSIRVAVDYPEPEANHPPGLRVIWQHDLSGRQGFDAPLFEVPSDPDWWQFNPVIGYRLSRHDQYDANVYVLHQSDLRENKFPLTSEVAIRVLPEALYRSTPSTIVVQGLPGETPSTASHHEVSSESVDAEFVDAVFEQRKQILDSDPNQLNPKPDWQPQEIFNKDSNFEEKQISFSIPISVLDPAVNLTEQLNKPELPSQVAEILTTYPNVDLSQGITLEKQQDSIWTFRIRRTNQLLRVIQGTELQVFCYAEPPIDKVSLNNSGFVWEASSIYLHQNIQKFLTSVRNRIIQQLNQKQDRSRWILNFHYPLENRNQNSSHPYLQDQYLDQNSNETNTASFRDYLVQLSKDLSKGDFSKSSDPYGWWSSEILGLSCECSFIADNNEPIPTELILDAVRSIEEAYPVTLCCFLAEDGQTLLNVVRVVCSYLPSFLMELETDKDLEKWLDETKVKLGQSLTAIVGSSSSETLNITAADGNVVSVNVSDITTKASSNHIVQFHHSVQQSSGGISKQSQIVLPIRREGSIHYQLPVSDHWAHEYLIAIEPVRRYETLLNMLLSSQVSDIASNAKPEVLVPGDQCKAVKVARTQKLERHSLIATPLPGSIQAIVFRHPAAFAAVSSAVTAAYGQYSGQTVLLHRRIKDRAKLLGIYMGDKFQNINWEQYNAWLRTDPGPETELANYKPIKLLSDNQKTPLQPIKDTEIAIYGADRYVFPDLPAYYEYQVSAYSTAGRVSSDPEKSAWISPLYDTTRQQPKTEPCRLVGLEDNPLKLVIELPLIYPRFHLLPELRPLWIDAEEKIEFSQSGNSISVKFGSLPDLHLTYQVYLWDNWTEGKSGTKVYIPLLRVKPPIESGWFEADVQVPGINSTDVVMELTQPNELRLKITVPLPADNPAVNTIAAKLTEAKSAGTDLITLFGLSVARNGVWSEIQPQIF